MNRVFIWASSKKKKKKYIRLTTTFHLTLMMTSAQVVETSVTTTDNSPSQDYTHPEDQTTLLLANQHVKRYPRVQTIYWFANVKL